MELKYLRQINHFQLASRNIDACIVDGMFLVHSHLDLPSTIGGQANMTLSRRLVRRANHVDFACYTFKSF